jgi:hypothetical protein
MAECEVPDLIDSQVQPAIPANAGMADIPDLFSENI